MSLFGHIELPGAPDLENVRKLDVLPIPMIRRMSRLGIAIDPDYFDCLTDQFSMEMDRLEKDISSYVPAWALGQFCSSADAVEALEGDASINANSAEQIAKLLFDVLKVGRDKKLKTTAGGKRLSTGKKQLELVRLEHPVVPLILDYRERSKLISTYTRTLPRIARFHPHGSDCPVCGLTHLAPSWRVHTEFTSTRADTGRFSSKNPNLQNIPARTTLGELVKAGFLAGEGMRLVSCDFSQIELRCLAHLAEAHSMIQVYLDRGDIHDNTGRKVFGLPADVKPDKLKHRMASKRTNFGIQNGTTEKGLYLQLVMDYGTSGLTVPDWLTEEWCKWFIEQWLATYPEVPAYFDLQYYRARRYGMIWDAFGRVKLIPEVRSTHSWIRSSGLRQAQNMPVTSTAAGQMKLAMAEAEQTLMELVDAGVWVWPLLTVHDQLMVETEEDAAEEVGEQISNVFAGVMRDQFRVPIEADAEILQRWQKT